MSSSLGQEAHREAQRKREGGGRVGEYRGLQKEASPLFLGLGSRWRVCVVGGSVVPEQGLSSWCEGSSHSPELQVDKVVSGIFLLGGGPADSFRKF